MDFDQVKADFEAAGWTVFSTEFVNTKTPLKVRCRQGHIQKVSYGSVRRGNYCDTCARKSGYGGNKGSLEKCRAMVEAVPGYTLLDTVYQPHPWKIHVRCPNGHEYKVIKGSFSNGARCHQCFVDRVSGTNHYAWRHDLTPEQRKKLRTDRKSQKAKCWKKAVLKRDGYICQKCGSRKKLVGHHIKNWIDYEELRYEVSNGITLCSPCHDAFHSRFGKRYTNEDQLACFLEDLKTG
ncbi:HNH endonuclease [Leptolyngbya ohadii]|uniref:HNH endonuclease n=1 Tax=Leptolyngbya ohadii TaxID=1962290 RepID=UPI0015C5C6F9|nr:HNH endonuclease [Leptolyngbya ohadii]